MSFSIGIVGLPNVGKSTLFRALTKKQVPAENFPFCTIDPNVGVVAVPDDRLEKLSAICQSGKIVPTTIEFVDIAGLVQGAHKGEGLGNKFLSHIREVDAIAHVVRDFKNDDIVHVENRIDREADEQIILLELIMADLSTVDKKIKDCTAKIRGQDKEAQIALGAFEKIKTRLDAGQVARGTELTEEEILATRDTQLLTAKPMLTVVNVSEDEVVRREPKNNEVIISAKIESELSELPDAEAKEMLKELGMHQTGLDKLIVASYKLLNLITFFTAGPMESKAWTITAGTKAPQGAGVIHTDFEKGFIRAEVISYQDFVDCNGESGTRDKGKLRTEGKTYEIRDGDVCHFLFN